ncbi:MAG: response regulator [Clostridium sp.]|nr:response regulator [Clostridium sp.]
MLYDDDKREKILIVDDVETNRIILEEIIKNMGYAPILAESGEMALEMVKQSSPQLILTDISMPGMDGYELCKILKEKEETKNIPIVFISAFDDPKDIVEGFFLGGEDYITKPFIPEVVQARVGVQLRLHETKRKLMEMNRRLQISVGEQLKQMELEKKNILYAMANIAAQNSRYNDEHMKRVKKNCRILAQGMQLSPLFEDKVSDTDIDTIELAAPLCDIGTIGISQELLQKESLTDEEVKTIQNHTNIGAKLLSDLWVNSDYNDFISMAIDIAHYHHENWDGSGYPDGLKGEEIPLAAQIVSIVERYCVLVEKKNLSKEDALATMAEEENIKINPDIFKIYCKISRQLY